MDLNGGAPWPPRQLLRLDWLQADERPAAGMAACFPPSNWPPAGGMKSSASRAPAARPAVRAGSE